MAANGASSVTGGNWQIFAKFIEVSGANLHLNTEVTSIKRKSSTQWTIASKTATTDYDSVILAAPYHLTNVTITPSSISDQIPAQPYVYLHVTIFTTTSATPNPAYFNLSPNATAPIFVLTTSENERANEAAGGKGPEFEVIEYLAKLTTTDGVESDDEFVVKIFSLEEISDDWLDTVFDGKVGWILRHEVRSSFSPHSLSDAKSISDGMNSSVESLPVSPANDDISTCQTRPRILLCQRV